MTHKSLHTEADYAEILNLQENWSMEKQYVPSSLFLCTERVMTDYDRQDIKGMPLCKEHKQWHQCATSKICSLFFRCSPCVAWFRQQLITCFFISGGFFMVVYIFWGLPFGFFFMVYVCFISSFPVIVCFLYMRKLNIIIPLDVL